MRLVKFIDTNNNNIKEYTDKFCTISINPETCKLRINIVNTNFNITTRPILLQTKINNLVVYKTISGSVYFFQIIGEI